MRRCAATWRSGFAVLVTDKPGVVASTGDWRRQTFYDRAEQAAASLQFLRGRPEVQARPVGLFGFSQGAWICLLAAAQDPSIPFIIPVSGPAIRPLDQGVYYVEHVMQAQGYPAAEIERATGFVRYVLKAAQQGLDYGSVSEHLIRPVAEAAWYALYPIPDGETWEYFRRNAVQAYGPAAWLAQVRCPLLAIFGGVDERVADGSVRRVSGRPLSPAAASTTR